MSDHGQAGQPLRAAGLVDRLWPATQSSTASTLPSRTGAFTALVGPNGSGKSTILRALAGLLPRATRHGPARRPVDRQPVRPRRSRGASACLSQGPIAPEGLTVRDLVQQGRYPHRTLFGRWSDDDEAACEEALSLTGMAALGDRRLDSLSGGQRQRAWIAMALAQKTGILLLDEPTTFLDLAHQIEILDLIADLVRTRRTTVVAVLHDLNQAARYADQIVLLKRAAIVADGLPRSVLTVEAIADVFGVDCHIIEDPVSGKPLCIPIGKSGLRACLSSRSCVANLQQIGRNCGSYKNPELNTQILCSLSPVDSRQGQ